MDAALATLLVGIAGVGGTVTSGYLAQRAAQRALRLEHERQRHENLRDCYIAINSRARSCRYALADYVQAMATNTLTDEIRQRAATAINAHHTQYDEAQMVVTDSVLAEARSVNDKIGVLYGVLRRIDCGDPREDDTIEQVKRLLKELWPPCNPCGRPCASTLA
ncbi:hypothetical protein BFF78_27875 [Streptomyces fodineus]|uniref:Uncharacterized protein n=1 Tax=Streptomyces fodineus TaxID=1904616 RepID=A0A1D7YFS6_9ACTN|nr:hypothetical protein [Streptomyces fodineus]AOR34360.1 hypothetical protein BFF78_27875 [Streptomyces fodineus]